MAKCSVHGNEIGTVYFTTTAKRYMSDGVILKNAGFGWKLHGKVKESVTPEIAFKNQLEHTAQFERENPCFAAYRKALHDVAGIGKRWKLHAAIELMPDDPE